MKRSFTLLAILVFFVGEELLRADEIQTVMLSGQPAPGTEAVFGPNQLGGFQINNAGQAVIRASISGSGVNSTNSRGIWTGMSGSLDLVARTGDEAPGLGSGVTFNTLGNTWISDSGRVGFEANLQGSGITTANDRSLWTDRSGSLSLGMHEGDAAPGTAAGVNFVDGPFVAMFNGDKFAFYSFLTGPGVMSNNRQGLWSEGSGTLSLVARNGSPDPATGDPFLTTNHDFEGVRLNNVGQLAFSEGMGAGSVQKIWFDDAGSLSLIVGTGDTAPGTGAGVTFNRLHSPILNDVGKVAFKGNLTGTGVTISNNLGVWSGEAGSLTLRFRTGQQAPGLPAGVMFSEMPLSPWFNNQGHLAFNGRVTGGGVTSSNNSGIWSDASGTLTLLARAGDPAPGVVPAMNFEQLITAMDVNDLGQVAFYAILVDAATPTLRYGSIWAQDSEGVLQLIARSGEQIDVDNGPGVDLRTISGLSLNSINDVGQVAFTALADGADGFFVSNALSSADFDHDGDVDGRDFLVWQRGGSPAPFSAGNLALWQEQYAAAGGELTAAVQVPEPGACVLLAIVAALVPVRGALG